jgi:hypothetical protein
VLGQKWFGAAEAELDPSISILFDVLPASSTLLFKEETFIYAYVDRHITYRRIYSVLDSMCDHVLR